ncbi:MAG: DUF3370 family protein [Candidatus Sericytochromatia bacterium]|nr:DUF3370 family protein [Candidatus Sericytochromatia bacterium]
MDPTSSHKSLVLSSIDKPEPKKGLYKSLILTEEKVVAPSKDIYKNNSSAKISSKSILPTLPLNFHENNIISNNVSSDTIEDLPNLKHKGSISIEVDDPEQPQSNGLLFSTDNLKEKGSFTEKPKLGVDKNTEFKFYSYSDVKKIKSNQGYNKPIYQSVIITNPSNKPIEVEIKGSGYNNSQQIANKFDKKDKAWIDNQPEFKNAKGYYESTRVADMKLASDSVSNNNLINKTITIKPGESAMVYTKLEAKPDQTNARSEYNFKVVSGNDNPDFKDKGLKLEAAILKESDMNNLTNQPTTSNGVIGFNNSAYNSVPFLKNHSFVIGERAKSGVQPDGQLALGRVNSIKEKSEIESSIPEITLDGNKFAQSYSFNKHSDAVNVQATLVRDGKEANVNNVAYGNYNTKYVVNTVVNNTTSSKQDFCISLGTPSQDTKTDSRAYTPVKSKSGSFPSTSFTGTVKISVNNQEPIYVNVVNQRVDSPNLLKRLSLPSGKNNIKVETVIPTNSTGSQVLRFSTEDPHITYGNNKTDKIT